jgi:H+/Cl- antiporter ClcA
MKILNTLRTCIKIFYYLALISLLISVVVIISIIFFQSGFSDVFTINFKEYSVESKWETVMLIITAYIPVLVGFCAVYCLKKFVDDISLTNLFSEKQVVFLRKIGVNIIVYIIVSYVISFILDVIYNRTTKIGFSYEDDLISNYFFILIIGLFFIFLSEIFKIAKQHKEENELTV